ncbi:MAG: HDOD domain-containing protein, partial [Paraglaciecola sp.]|nr:HDOD domain-containing protein [Paraglaciecola sp.]
DFLSAKAATISRVETLAGQIPWFYQELLKVANQPKYRRTDSKGKTILIDSLRVALNMFGIENLNPVVLSLAIRRWLPQITDPYPKIKNRIWEEALATALSAKRLAPLYDVNEDNAFSLGMLHVIGTIVVVRLYFRLFDTVQREALVDAQNQQLHEQHNAISRLEPSGEFLNQLIDKYALAVSADLINMMDLKRIFIADAMQEVANKAPLAEITPLALILTQAMGYSRYRLLKMNSLINVDEAKTYVASLGLPKGALALLKITDIRTLNLVVLNK